jgi:hypothetical protein
MSAWIHDLQNVLGSCQFGVITNKVAMTILSLYFHLPNKVSQGAKSSHFDKTNLVVFPLL